MRTEFPLMGKVALVTGSGRGMGRQNAIELASRGADLVINYLNSGESAEEVVKVISDMGRRAIAIQADVSDPVQIASLFEQAARYYGHIDIVISNSGLEHFGSLQEVTPEDFDRVFAVNTKGQFFVAQQAHRYLTEGGCLILMSSVSAHAKGVRKHSLYSGSKAAVEAFARCLATEFSDKNITVNAIAPGGVTTEATRKFIHRSEGGPNEQWTWSDENVEEVVSTFMPLHTAVVLDVVARVLAFLASEDGCLTNGKTISIFEDTTIVGW